MEGDGSGEAERGEVGGEGGTMTMLKSQLACDQLDSMEQLRKTGDVEDLSGVNWHLRGGNLVLL